MSVQESERAAHPEPLPPRSARDVGIFLAEAFKDANIGRLLSSRQKQFRFMAAFEARARQHLKRATSIARFREYVNANPRSAQLYPIPVELQEWIAREVIREFVFEAAVRFSDVEAAKASWSRGVHAKIRVQVGGEELMPPAESLDTPFPVFLPEPPSAG